jgi:hypothetical protein
MPNWCFNEIRASEKVLKTIFDENTKQISFQKIIPMPDSLNVTSGSYINNAIYYTLLQMNQFKRLDTIRQLSIKNRDTLKSLLNVFDKGKIFEENYKKLCDISKDFKPSEEEKKLGIETFKQLGQAYIDNILKYEYTDWYGWRCANWGTKWDACDTCGEPKDGAISFMTAWNPPEKIVEKLIANFPKENIDWYYEEPGMNFAGTYSSDGKGGYVDIPCEVPKCEDDEELES